MNRKAITAAPDPRDLEAWGEVGHVNYIDGKEADECPNFVPTRFELEELTRYWFRIEKDNRELFQATGQSRKTELRESLYASQRLDRLAEILGTARVERLICGVERILGVDASLTGVLRHLLWVLANKTALVAQRVRLTALALACSVVPRDS